MEDAVFLVPIAPQTGIQTLTEQALRPEPAAIIRAALHNRSLCLILFNFRYLLSILIFGEWDQITCSHFSTTKTLITFHLYSSL